MYLKICGTPFTGKGEEMISGDESVPSPSLRHRSLFHPLDLIASVRTWQGKGEIT